MPNLAPNVPYLIAKWRDWDPEAKEHFKVRGFNLAGHISACMTMGDYLLTGCRFGDRLFTVMDLGRFTNQDEFRRLCLMSLLCHDLGKAGSEFQEFLWQPEHLYLKHLDHLKHNPATRCEFKKPCGDNRYRQKYRHEALSAVLMTQNQTIWDWLVLAAGSEANATMVVSGSFGHHLKTDMDRAVKVQDDPKPRPIYLAEISRILNRLSPKFGLPAFPECSDVTMSPKQVCRGVSKFHADHMDEDVETPLSAAIKFVTILADSFGSMSPKDHNKIVGYHKVLQGSLDMVCGKPGTKRKPIRFRRHLEAKVRETNTKGWKSVCQKLYAFQKKARDVDGLVDAILTAACGRGKTIAGYLWASKRPDLKLIFTTPTTSTATQINMDYVRKDKRGTTGIRHSRQGVDALLERERKEARAAMEAPDILLIPTPEESPQAQMEAEEEYAGLIQDFHGFNYEVTHATVDQVLGVLAYSRRSIMWLLYLVDAQIVFDEFHCYDQTMQKWFTRFLDWFPGIRIMCMSATIADQQRDAVLASRPNAVSITDDDVDSPAKRPRYRIHVVKSREEAEAHFKKGTLWIVNQVKVSQDIGRAFLDSIVCHSRFGYRDRSRIQQELVDGFRSLRKDLNDGIYAVATQVAEISLDISAWAMISEIADPATIIQRLGRLNRDADTKEIGHAYFYMPENGYPYNPRGSLAPFENMYLPWLQSLEGRDLTQEDLGKAFREYAGHKLPGDPLPFLPMTETTRRSIRQQQTTTLGIWSDGEPDDLADPKDPRFPTDPKARRRMWMSQIQALEMPLYLTPKERKVLVGQDKWFKYRYILDAPNFHYDKRLGLIKNFTDFDGAVTGDSE